MADGPNRRGALAEQDERARRVMGLAQRLLVDLARSGYGDEVGLEYLTPECASAVRRALATVTHDGHYVETDYEESVAGTAELPEGDGNVRVELRVNDRSALREPSGLRIPLSPWRWLLELELDGRCTRITGVQVTAG